jgi:hypothetical protein
MVHTRETRAAACEVKFLIDPAVAPRIRDWARHHLQADPHGTGPFGDEYETTSLYFDTRRYDVLHRRRSFGRAKYRVRRYGASDQIFLERKLRKPGILIKRRTAMSIDALESLDRPDGPSDFAGEWFRRRLAIRRLHPACQVAYHRTARLLRCEEGTARLTLDGDLRAVDIDEARFANRSGVPFMTDRMILELKYNAYMPAVFRWLVEEFALAPQTASKYRLGMAALGYPRADLDFPTIGSTRDLRRTLTSGPKLSI